MGREKPMTTQIDNYIQAPHYHEVYAHAMEIFETDANVSQWMQTPLEALENRKPCELLDTYEDAQKVHDFLYNLVGGWF